MRSLNSAAVGGEAVGVHNGLGHAALVGGAAIQVYDHHLDIVSHSQEVAGSEVLYSGDANLTDEQIAKLPFALYRQGYEYYWKTHAHPNIFRSVRDIVPSKRWLL